MKKINKLVIIIIVLSILISFNCLFFYKSYGTSMENINFVDENFKNAIIELGYDSDNDGEISMEEACQISDLWIVDKGIEDISGIRYFENLKNVWISGNYIEDLSEFISLKSLSYLQLDWNKINYSPLRSYDENTINIVNKLKDNGVSIFGLHEQRLEYDAESVNEQPEYKVLFVYVQNIDVETEKDGKLVKYKHTLTNEETLYFDEYRKMFEKCVEKLSNYSINITTESYITQNTISEISVGYDMENKVYSLMAENISEIQDKVNQYDTIFVCNIYDDNLVYHTAAGLGGTRFSDTGNIYGNAMVYFHSDDVEEIEALKDNRITTDISIGIHEFIHTVEMYGTYMGFNIWEWHDAEGYYSGVDYNVSNTTVLAESYYLQGKKNPNGDGSTGIPTHVWEITPSEIANKSIAINKSELNMVIGENQALYCSVKDEDYDGTTPNQWGSNVIWESDNEKVASVSENGTVIANTKGQCIIVARDAKNDTHYIECIVNVNEPTYLKKGTITFTDEDGNVYNPTNEEDDWTNKTLILTLNKGTADGEEVETTMTIKDANDNEVSTIATDGKYTIVVTTTYYEGKTDTVTYKINIDKTAPAYSEVTLDLQNTKTGKIVVTVKDLVEEVSGLNTNIGWNLLNGSASAGSGSATLDTENGTFEIDLSALDEGKWTGLVFTIEDNAGNPEHITIEKTICYDKTAPTIAVTPSTTEETTGKVTLTVVAVDAGVGLHTEAYSFDGGTIWQAGNTKEYSENTTGIQVVVRDALGNTTAPTTIDITNIVEEPVLPTDLKKGTITFKDEDGNIYNPTNEEDDWINKTLTLTLNKGTADGKEVETTYTINGSESTETALTADGKYTIVVTTTYYEGKTDTVTYKINIDQTAPTAGTITFANADKTVYTPGENSWTNQDVTLTKVNGTDNLSGPATTTYTINGTESTETTLTPGKYTITITTTDNAGNTSETLTYKVNIDETKPTIQISPNGATGSTSQEVTITVSDSGESGLNSSNSYQYQLSTSKTEVPTGEWINYASGTKFVIGTDLTGDYYLWIKTISDNAGNKSSENEYIISEKFVFNNKEEEISSTKYTISEDNIISNILPGADVAEVLGNIIYENKSEIKIYNQKGEEITEGTLVGTGMTLKVNDKEYTLIVKGDTTGEGIINVNDAIRTLRHLAGGTHQKLTGAYLNAAQIIKEGQVNINDAIRILRYIATNGAEQL